MITNIINDTTSNVVETSVETSATTASNLTRQFQCSLNPVIQLDKIINDAHLPNFKLEANNSGFNVNIRCNSGTYARVVKPTITTIDNKFTATANEYFCNFSLLSHQFLLKLPLSVQILLPMRSLKTSSILSSPDPLQVVLTLILMIL